MNTLAKYKIWLVGGIRTPLLSALFLLCLGFSSPAQQNKLIVAQPDPIEVKRGQTVVQTLNVTVLPGFHVNSDKPREEFLIPLKLTWTDGPLEAKSVAYPKAEEIQVGGDNLLAFTGKFEVRTEFRASENAPAGAAIVVGKLRFQACDQEKCFRPASVEVRVPVTIQ